MIILATVALLTTSQVGPVRPVTAKVRPERTAMIRAVIEAGRRYEVDPLWLLAVAHVESRYKLRITGDGGRSHGPFQMSMGAARTARRTAKKAELYQWPATADLAAKYWARLFRKYGPRVAPVIYNCGPVRCRRKDGTHLRDTRATKAYWRAYRALLVALEGVPDMWRYATYATICDVCADMRRYATVCDDMQDMRRYAEICDDMRRYATICKNCDGYDKGGRR